MITRDTTVEEIAQEYLEKASMYVHGYVGSSMLTAYEYPEQILNKSRELAKELVAQTFLIIDVVSTNQPSDLVFDLHRKYAGVYLAIGSAEFKK